MLHLGDGRAAVCAATVDPGVTLRDQPDRRLPDPAAALLPACAPARSTCPATPATTTARSAWNLAVDQRPAAVCLPANADEVADVVRAAAAAGLRVAPQTTGHNAGPLGDLDRHRASAHLRDDRGDRRRRAPDRPRRGRRALAGRRSRRPRRTAWPPCTAPPPTSASPATPWAAASAGTPAQLGLATNSVTAVELVTADGTPGARRRRPRPRAVLGAARRRRQLRRRHRHGVPALRPDRDRPTPGCWSGTRTQAERVLRTLGRPGPTTPRTAVTTSFRMLNLPPMPEIPEPFRGRPAGRRSTARCSPTTSAAAAILADAARARARRWTPSRGCPSAALVRLHMDPEGPTPAVSASTILADLPDAGGRDVPGADRPGLRARRCWPPSCASSAARWPGRPRAPGRCRCSTARSCSSRWPSRPRRRWPPRATPTPTALVDALAPYSSGGTT